jgi:hypothetical protein
MQMQLRMELFRINGKVLGFVTIEGDVIHAYLYCKIVAMQQQLMGIASLIEEMSGKSTPLIDSHIALINLFYSQGKMMATV